MVLQKVTLKILLQQRIVTLLTAISLLDVDVMGLILHCDFFSKKIVTLWIMLKNHGIKYVWVEGENNNRKLFMSQSFYLLFLSMLEC